jgi:hypothetical protein
MQTFLNLLSQKCVKVDKIWFRGLFFAPKLAILSMNSSGTIVSSWLVVNPRRRPYTGNDFVAQFIVQTLSQLYH